MLAIEQFHTLKCLHEVLDSLRFEISFINWEEIYSREKGFQIKSVVITTGNFLPYIFAFLLKSILKYLR